MTLRAVPGGSRTGPPGRPGAGPVPTPAEVLDALEPGESVLWFRRHDRTRRGPPAIVAGLATVVLAGVSLFAPEIWNESPSKLAKAIAVLYAPALLAWLRERGHRRMTVITDRAVLDVLPDHEPNRLALRNVRRARRDRLWGGIRLEGGAATVRVPGLWSEEARSHLVAARGPFAGASQALDDPDGLLRG